MQLGVYTHAHTNTLCGHRQTMRILRRHVSWVYANIYMLTQNIHYTYTYICRCVVQLHNPCSAQTLKLLEAFSSDTLRFVERLFVGPVIQPGDNCDGFICSRSKIEKWWKKNKSKCTNSNSTTPSQHLRAIADLAVANLLKLRFQRFLLVFPVGSQVHSIIVIISWRTHS